MKSVREKLHLIFILKVLKGDNGMSWQGILSLSITSMDEREIIPFHSNLEVLFLVSFSIWCDPLSHTVFLSFCSLLPHVLARLPPHHFSAMATSVRLLSRPLFESLCRVLGSFFELVSHSIFLLRLDSMIGLS